MEKTFKKPYGDVLDEISEHMYQEASNRETKLLAILKVSGLR